MKTQLPDKPSIPGRILSHTAVILVLTTIIFLVIDLFLAWQFTSRLIHPVCAEPQPHPHPIKPEEHWIDTEDGLKIKIWYYPPQNGAVILLFSGLGGALGTQYPPVDFLLNEGYGIIQVDSRTCAIPSAQVTLGGNELLDAEAALDFALEQPEVKKDRIGTFGFSMGGATAIRLAARQPEVRAVVRDGGYADLREMLAPEVQSPMVEKIFKWTIYRLFKYRTGIDPESISPIQELPFVSPRPVLFIYGEAEAESGIAQFKAAGQGSVLWIVADSTHGHNYIVAPQEYPQKVLNFFNQALIE